MLRIESRQWALIVALISITVGAGIVLVAAGLNVSPVEGADRGNATHKFTIDEPPFDTVLAEAAAAFDIVDSVAVSLAFPTGSGTPVDVRSLDPAGSNVGPLIDLKGGRYPSEPAEIAGTRNQLERLGLAIGDSVSLDERTFDVVGIVENPTVLSEDFFLIAPGATEAEFVDVLVSGSDAAFDGFMADRENVSTLIVETDARTATTMILTILVAAVLAEVALLAAAVLTVLAQRRTRQLGVIAAIGAGKKQVRAAVVAGGVVAGLVAVAIGVVAGVVTSLLAVPLMEPLADRRITSVELPWIPMGLMALFAMAASTIAAWWPARKMSRVGVAGSLRASRPEATTPVRMTAIGTILIVAGAAALIYVFSLDDPARPFFIDVAAFLAVPIGAVLLAPMAVRLLARLTPAQWLSSRVALRDMGRYQSRSAATAAALVVVLTFPVAGAVGFRIAEQAPDNVATMAPEHLLITASVNDFGVESAMDLTNVSPSITQLAADLGATAVPLTQAVFELDEGDSRPPVRTNRGLTSEEEVPLGSLQPVNGGIVTDRRGNDFSMEMAPTYVGTEELLAAVGLPADAIGTNDVLTNRRGDFALVDLADNDVRLIDDIQIALAEFPRYSRTPGALLSPGYVATLDLALHTTGWLLVQDSPFTNSDIATATTTAGLNGLDVVAFEPGINGSGVMRWALLVAGLLAIGIVAMVSALHRAETSKMAMAYEAIGASVGFRRNVHALTIGALVAVAALLAAVAGVVSQIGFAKEILGLSEIWRMVPVPALLVIVVLIPMVAFAMAWLSASRERPATART